MWQKYYKIAERQLLSGKEKTVEGHIEKALKAAEEEGDLKGIAKCMALKAQHSIQCLAENATDVIGTSVEAQLAAFGKESMEYADELEMKAVWLEHLGQIEEAEDLFKQSVAIHKDLGEPERYIETLSDFVDFYLEAKQAEKAHQIHLEMLEQIKKHYGSRSEELGEEIGRYALILASLGRKDQALKFLESLGCPASWAEESALEQAHECEHVHEHEHEHGHEHGHEHVHSHECDHEHKNGHADSDEDDECDEEDDDFEDEDDDEEDEHGHGHVHGEHCQHDHDHVHEIGRISPAVQSLLEQLESEIESLKDDDIKVLLDKYGACCEAVAKVIEAEEKELDKSCPFHDLQVYIGSLPLIGLRSQLAVLWRRKWCEEGKPEDAQESARLFRECLQAADQLNDRLHLIISLVDVATLDASDTQLLNELKELIDSVPECAFSLYSKALVGFLSEGANSQNRELLSAAIVFNPHVARLILSGAEVHQRTEEFVLREQGEAEEYAMHAGHQWRKIKGALEHMKETVERSVPKTLRQELKSYI